MKTTTIILFALLVTSSVSFITTSHLSSAHTHLKTYISTIEANDSSISPSVSADGRFVSFGSYASNLVPGDKNRESDIFIRDTQTGTTKRVSIDSQGNEGNHFSGYPSISADGRFVVFLSYASNLVSGDKNRESDIFLHDTQTGTTKRVSIDSQGNEGNRFSYSPSISANGRFVVFESQATNFVPDDNNGRSDIFLHDTQTGTTKRVSVDSQGNEGNHLSFTPSVSADGRFVSFGSYASNLVPGDRNGKPDIFLYDTQTGTTKRVNVDSQGNEGNSFSGSPLISAEGRFITFGSDAGNLVPGDKNGKLDVFLHDTQTGTTIRMSVDSQGNEGNSISEGSSVSAEARFIAFESYASNLVPGDKNRDSDIFLHDTQTGTTKRVSVDSQGNEGNSISLHPSISADGRFIAFRSDASNLVPNDNNNVIDIFLHDTQTGTTKRVSVGN